MSELTQQIKSLLEEAVPTVWVSGEITSLSRPSSGHLYFNLKDAGAQIRAVMWRSAALRLRFQPEEGLAVVAQGRLSVYPQRGEYQLQVQTLQPRGLGAADLAMRQLREKLARLGYFSRERKKPLPRFPRDIALVTSRSGAAIRDMLEILGRRWPIANVLVCPVPVQGDGAARKMAAALRFINRLRGIDVVILARGGGSSDDLAQFNEEMLAQAIFESRIPIVSAVGHEVDVTIADQVADCRALTPSEAAELVAPDCRELTQTLTERAGRMSTLLQRRLQLLRQRLTAAATRRPFAEPFERLRTWERMLDQAESRLHRTIERSVAHDRRRVEHLASQLQGLSPLNVLARGYSLTQREGEDELLRSADQVRPGDRILTRLHEGTITSTVD